MNDTILKRLATHKERSTMNDTILKLGLAAVISLGLALTASQAQQTGGVRIGDDVEITARVDDVTTTADDDSLASTGIGVVRGDTVVVGDVEITAVADDVTTRASNSSCAETTIGGVGDGPCQ